VLADSAREDFSGAELNETQVNACRNVQDYLRGPFFFETFLCPFIAEILFPAADI